MNHVIQPAPPQGLRPHCLRLPLQRAFAFAPLTLGLPKPIIHRDVERVIFSPLDTPSGLGRGYFFGGGR
jgi:hypothetical protein